MSTVSSSVVATETPWWDTTDIRLGNDFYKYQSEVQESILGFLSPLNLSIFAIIITIIYLRARPSQLAHLDPHRPITFRTFTPRILLKYNGEKSDMNPTAAVYLAVRGKVYDVSPGRNFYGPGGPYENFAGRDATRGLACQSFSEDMLTKDLDGAIDPCEDLNAEEIENLKGWIERFDEKYLIVGKLLPYIQSVSEW